jgi:hypothetical protein
MILTFAHYIKYIQFVQLQTALFKLTYLYTVLDKNYIFDCKFPLL